ncbi:probable polygalacturonase At1g80170 isoform X2 [Hibiscus syriacus]|uniref:probable polygalacturonase At1g80170 isoform X2 n=1 Tax=Hibiscus syriacus TaxID=106335 RepID=UPI001923687A|nr:probable polygalacturonase At1g80170 isoform X2 [Hibiscus syriacus]
MKNPGFILCSSCSTCNSIVFICIFMSMRSSVAVHSESFELDSLLQLPQSGSPKILPIAKKVLSLIDFGAKGDGYHNDSKAFEKAWNVACSFRGRIRIVIPAGYTYLIHPFQLGGPCKSKITLMISGTIVAPKSPHVWDGLNPRKWLYFHEVKHLRVAGGGTINGMGQKWWARSCKRKKKNALTFHRCKDLKVHDITMVDSQQMHVAFTNCLRVTVSNLKVIAPATSPNTDGIHISSSRGVEVKNSIVRTGDDCVSIVGNTSRVQIRNIVCGPGHGISIGSLGKSNSSSQVRNILVDRALISNTENGVRIKTWQGGNGYASDMKFTNILMENVAYPIIIDQYYCDSDLPCANQTLAVKVENISYVHIKGTSATEEAIRFVCSDRLPCEGLYLEDIQLDSSDNGGVTKSFCWEAYGSSSGLVQPSPCLTCTGCFIKQKVISGLAVDSF